MGGNTILLLYIAAVLLVAVCFELKKQSFVQFLKTHLGSVLISFFLVAGLTIRAQLFFFESGDYLNALLPWYNRLLEYGGFEGVKHFAKISDYAPSYLYFLSFLAEFKINALVGIKVFSVLFDVFLSWGAYLVIKYFYDSSSRLPILCFGFVFLCPTVLVNSALWGQCDAIHTAFVLFALLFLLKEKKAWALIFWGLAFSFKVQSVFVFLPFLVLFFTGRVTTFYFLLVPAVYLVLGIPAYILEAGAGDVLLVYTKQADNYPHYTLNAPSIYCLIPGLSWYEGLKSAGIAMAMFVGISFALLISAAKNELTNKRLVLLFLLSSVLFPFLLPKMHERYFYSADVLGIVFAFCYARYWYIPLLIIFASLTSYYPFLLGTTLIEMKYAAMLVFFVIVRLAHLSYEEFYGKPSELAEC